ncbi:MAG: hypothetical protein Q9N67_05520 [Ghiorsea sp.]|nr:hypothetical protein [Ghiorsea sp.]
MLSPDYFEYRWSWYRPILMQGESAAKRCRVDARRLPLCIPGEDAREYVPYAIDPQLTLVFTNAVRKLHEYSIKYMIDRVRVSAHQLPQMTPVSRAMFKHLQALHPHLPMTLLHHWCADELGGVVLLNTLNGMWEQSWEQDKLDSAPWVPAVNVFILRLIRDAISGLSNKHALHNDRVMVSVLGGVYDWALRAFLKQYIDGAVEMTRIATYETMIIPATPIAFLYQQPDTNLLADTRSVISAYGLDPDLLPRMREVRDKIGARNEAGILTLVAKERMGEHMLKRSWARLSLWALAQKTKQGVWMQWVQDAKKLDALIARPEKLPAAVIRLLESAKDEHPVAAWLLTIRDHALKGKKAKSMGSPWLQGEVVLNAFRVFEEDVKVEAERRKQESLWMNRTPEVIKNQRGMEAIKLMQKAYEDGDLVYFQLDRQCSLHSGSALASKQGCLRIEWSDYLSGMTLMVKDHVAFLSKSFLPGVLQIIDEEDHVFLDQVSASGCFMRGRIRELLHTGTLIKTKMKDWYEDVDENGGATNMPAVTMCIALLGGWDFIRHKNKDLGSFTLAFSLSVSQADAGVTRDVGVGRLITYREQRLRKLPLGHVRVDKIASGTGHSEYLMHNTGFALTSQALNEFVSSMQNKSVVKEFNPIDADAKAVLSEYRIPPSGLKVVCVRPRADGERVYIFIRAGRLSLAGMDTEIYELLDEDSSAAHRIYHDGLPRWQ